MEFSGRKKLRRYWPHIILVVLLAFAYVERLGKQRLVNVSKTSNIIWTSNYFAIYRNAECPKDHCCTISIWVQLQRSKPEKRPIGVSLGERL